MRTVVYWAAALPIALFFQMIWGGAVLVITPIVFLTVWTQRGLDGFWVFHREFMFFPLMMFWAGHKGTLPPLSKP